MARRTGFGVALEAQHDFRRTVPSGSDVFCHVTGILLRVDRETSGKTKVANLELAVGIDEQVSGLQVTVQNVGGVDVFETAKNLVDEGLEVSVSQRLARTDDGSKIAFHQLYSMLSALSSLSCLLVMMRRPRGVSYAGEFTDLRTNRSR